MNIVDTMLIKQAMQMIEEQDLRGWTEFHDTVILQILKDALNENA